MGSRPRNADQSVPFETGCYHRGAFPKGDFSVELIEAHATYPYPWQGGFADVDVGVHIAGLAPLLLVLAAFKAERRGDWSRDMMAYHATMVTLAEAIIFLGVNRLIGHALSGRSFARSVPIIVGTHDFGNFDPVVHSTG